MEQWALGPNECKAEIGIVREGIQYGEEDHKCTELTRFVRRCGHEEKVLCNKAFEMAKLSRLKPCIVRVPAVNPHCGRK